MIKKCDCIFVIKTIPNSLFGLPQLSAQGTFSGTSPVFAPQIIQSAQSPFMFGQSPFGLPQIIIQTPQMMMPVAPASSTTTPAPSTTTTARPSTTTTQRPQIIILPIIPVDRRNFPFLQRPPLTLPIPRQRISVNVGNRPIQLATNPLPAPSSTPAPVTPTPMAVTSTAPVVNIPAVIALPTK